MPERRITDAVLDEHAALREARLDLMDRHCLDIEEAMERAGFGQDAIDLVTTLVNDDPYMCAEVRRLRAEVSRLSMRLYLAEDAISEDEIVQMAYDDACAGHDAARAAFAQPENRALGGSDV